MLVIREGGLGDIILTVPILRALRALCGPDIRIDALVREPVAGLLADSDIVDGVYAKGSKPWRTLKTIVAMRRRRYQVIVDLVSSPSLSFALWMLAIAPRAHRIGGDKAELQKMYHEHVQLPPRPSIHFMERLRRIAAFVIADVPVIDRVPWFDWPESVRRQSDAVWHAIVETPGSAGPARGSVLVNLSAGIPRRTWPVESYRQLLSLLIPEYRGEIGRWILTAAPAERPKAVELATSLACPEVVVLPLQSDFRVVIDLAGRVDLVVTPDTSILHAASATGVPVVVLTVAENVIAWAPWKIPSAVVSARTGLPVSAIPVAEVAAAFDRVAATLSFGASPHPLHAPAGVDP